MTNRELDELGKRLVIAGKPGEGEIDRLVSSPRLYDGVLTKIARADEPVREPRRRFVLRPVAVMAIAVALLSIPLLALLKYARTGDQVVKAPQVSPVAKTSQAPSYEVPKQPFVPVPAAPPEDAIDRPRPMRAVVTDTVETDRPRRIHKPPTARLPEPEPVFHPIGLPERAEDAAIDGRVVRVDMPRSALFALGVDLPLENGTRAVKADLLVGADGIPRGIRLVE